MNELMSIFGQPASPQTFDQIQKAFWDQFGAKK